MAELYIIGQILNAVDFDEPKLFCKWSIQIGSTWKFVEGLSEGQTTTNTDKIDRQISTFTNPIDVHLASRGIQGWPKIHVEVCAVNALNKYWPVGFGFAHIPTKPGFHKIHISTWKVSPGSYSDIIHDKFNTGGFTLSKSDLIYSGTERYKLSTKSSGCVNIEVLLIFKNFSNFGIEFD